MDFPEFKENKQEMITRLAICVVAALILYYAVTEFGGKLKIALLDQYRPWLVENKIQAIAVVAAVLFGASLAVFPLEQGKGPQVIEDDACKGFEPVGEL